VITYFQRVGLVLAIAAASTGLARAQDKPADAGPKTTTVPLRVQVVISRYDGDKKISSLPYILSVNAGGVATLRMGTKVPVATTNSPNGITSYTYQDVGTNIDCRTATTDDGRFRLEVTVDDSSVDEKSSGPINQPSFRSFRGQNSMVLKDGQSAQFTTAVDKLTGVVTKIDVSLTVVK
jgi:type II secretory pathway component GspD/PulD (secretin)